MHIITVYEATRYYEINFCSDGLVFNVRIDDSLGKVYNKAIHLMRLHGFKEADIVEASTGEVLYEFKAEE